MEVDHAAQSYLNDALVKRQVDKDLRDKCSGSEDGDTMNGCFDCNICLDFAAEPVVTLCGHLFCWPCIYKWLQVDSLSSHQCPVCKGPLSQDALVPLYGRGGLDAKSGSEIPLRSSLRNASLIASVFEQQSPGANEMYSHLHEPMQQQLHHHHQLQYSSSYGGADNGYIPPSPFFHSMAGGALGGLASSILPWLFRNHEMNMFYSSPYHFPVSGNSPRLRRQQMEVMSSLHQIWFFLFCCVVLCLLFF